MNDFNANYLEILRSQVGEEINFLVSNGHDSRQIFTPCIFCYKNSKGSFSCSRLNQLREFQSQIMQQLHQINTNTRQRIGYEPDDSPSLQQAIGSYVSNHELPKLLQPL